MWIGLHHFLNAGRSSSVNPTRANALSAHTSEQSTGNEHRSLYSSEFVQISNRPVSHQTVGQSHPIANCWPCTNGQSVSRRVRRTSSGQYESLIELRRGTRDLSLFRKNIPMSEVSHWFRIIVVNIVGVAVERSNASSRSEWNCSLDSAVLHDIPHDSIDRDEYH